MFFFKFSTNSVFSQANMGSNDAENTTLITAINYFSTDPLFYLTALFWTLFERSFEECPRRGAFKQ